MNPFGGQPPRQIGTGVSFFTWMPLSGLPRLFRSFPRFNVEAYKPPFSIKQWADWSRSLAAPILVRRKPSHNKNKEKTMQENALKELYIKELRDTYDAEKQITKALPKMAKAATSSRLREAFQHHLEQTKNHITRLEQIFEELDESPKGETCDGMEGLIEEGSNIIEENLEGEVKDAGLIAAAQRVEHYEMAAYGTVRTYANILGDKKAALLLQETLEEEKQTDQNLTTLAESINVKAAVARASD
jgi:ferritin-like metal-binding protein YciE